MTIAELLELIKNGENSGVEFKRDAIDNRTLAKEIVAFANLGGGRLLLGIEDDGTVSGVKRANIETWIMNACREKIRPEIIPYVQLFRDVEPGKDVALVQVDRGWSVHHLWHSNRRTHYLRIGSQCRKIDAEELDRLFQRRNSFRLETRPVSGTYFSDLDLRRLRDYFIRLRRQDVPGEGDIEKWQRLLINTGFMTPADDRVSASVAGLLLFGLNPNRFLIQGGLNAVANLGLEKEYAVRELISLRGPLTPLYGNSGLIEDGLVEQAVSFVTRNTDISADQGNGVRSKDRWDYPKEVIQEVVVNALIHRDYSISPENIELSIYSDRLEILSPGRLPDGLTPDGIQIGYRVARNQLLKDVMRDYGYIDRMGMGVPRKIVNGMKEHNGTEPELIQEGDQFIVRLHKK